MRFSVVINTYNRAQSLRATLDALRHQTFRDFEVVVVDGPSEDGTRALLAQRSDAVRAVFFDERNLAKSRNLGIDAAAGDVVAFIDDDAVPEPRWLEDLAAAYDDPAVGGAGGLTLDNTGNRAQYRYSLCDRMGRTDFDQTPPFDANVEPGANPFLYLQGTNCSFRRAALEAVEGFDEEIEYNYDESEICSRIIDAGYRLRALERAVVHHKFLPSHMRREVGFTDPFFPIKNRVYFALRVGREHYTRPEILESLTTYLDKEVKGWAELVTERGDLTRSELEFFCRRADEGFALGLERGVAGVRRGRPIAPQDPGAFLPYPVLDGPDRRLAVCFVTLDHPPRPVGGIARFTGDLARGFARAGHETHLVTRDDDGPLRTDLEDGVWVHRFPVADRWVPELEGHPLKGNLDHLAAVNAAVQRIHAAVRLDAVAGSLWIAEPLLCALDPQLPTAIACNTPIAKVAELQPETAAAPLTAHQIRLEQALLRSPAHLQPVSEENAKLCRGLTDRPMEVIWHGLEDRRDAHPRTRDDDGVEILFVGRLEPRKGIDTLLEAAVPLLRERPEVRLRIVGADNPHANGRPGVHEAWVREHGADVAERVDFAGPLDDDALFAAYANCDIFCGPSRYESFGLVHVEAMMMGRPVLACAAGGMTETVVEGETGTLVAPGDAAALRDALARLAADGELRERWGAAGRARYEAEFSLEVAVARNADFFARAADAPAPSGTQAANAAAMLQEVCELAPAAAEAAAEALLDTTRFPLDPEGALRRALDLPGDADFVDAAFRALLGRPPGPAGLEGYLSRLGTDTRAAVAREIAESDEARAFGITASLVDRLPDLDAVEVTRRLRLVALTGDHAEFATALAEIAGGDADVWRQRLEDGTAHADLVREVLADPATARRIAGPARVDADTVFTLDALADRLRGERDRGAFVDTAYRLLLGRAPDPGAERYVRMLGDGVPRAVIVHEIASSPEAQRRGASHQLADRLAAALSRRRVRVPGRAPAPLRYEDGRAEDLATRFEQLAVANAEDREALRDQLGALTDAQAQGAAGLRALTDKVEVLARKYEALALDLRDRIPAAAPEEAPAPEILRPEALDGDDVRVNVGAGEKPLPGYVNVDFRALPGIDVRADAARLPFAEGSVAELASHHLIEHFRQHYVETVLLPYWRTLLRPDGVLRVVTPNWAVMVEQLEAGQLTFAQFKQVTFGLQDYSGDDHFALYTPETLTAVLEAAGYERIEVVAERRQNGLSPELEVIARPSLSAL